MEIIIPCTSTTPSFRIPIIYGKEPRIFFASISPFFSTLFPFQPPCLCTSCFLAVRRMPRLVFCLAGLSRIPQGPSRRRALRAFPDSLRSHLAVPGTALGCHIIHAMLGLWGCVSVSPDCELLISVQKWGMVSLSSCCFSIFSVYEVLSQMHDFT